MRTVDSEMLIAGWQIGREIVERIQRGAVDAQDDGQASSTPLVH